LPLFNSIQFFVGQDTIFHSLNGHSRPVAGGRIGSFASLGLCVGLCGLQMCQLCVGRISKYFVRFKKKKKHWVGLSVGLLAVPFEYV
jgi:hypothetical protein